jgi:membrane protein required for colicin V production
MIWVDYCILAVFAVSALIGILRGFTREFLGVLTWLFAVWLAWAFADDYAPRLAGRIEAPELRLFCAMAALFLVGLFVAALITTILSLIVRNSLLSGTDRTLGGGFGLVRALLMVATFVLVADTMGARQERWWQDSALLGQFDWLAQGLHAIVPQSWLDLLRPVPSAAPAQPVAPTTPSPEALLKSLVNH